MEPILLTVTIVALVIAFITSAAAWRVMRRERARAAARVAALAAAASATDTPAHPRVADSAAIVRPAPEPRVADSEPASATIEARTPSRVSTFASPRNLAAASSSSLPDLTLNASAEPALRHAAAPMADTFLSGDRSRPSENRQRRLAAAAAILSVALAGGAYWLLSGSAESGVIARGAAPSANGPLELLSLRHERVGARLSLSGLVRNPAGAATVDELSAVVFLFDAKGAFISSARSGVDYKHLAPGDESPFVITVDAPSNVSRYRVSFRTDAGILAHVDRRSEQPRTTASAGKS